MTQKVIRVLCVDDSALIRQVMARIINDQPDMKVVALARDPFEARELIKAHEPDVITLDVEMPRMDGLDFLGRLMRLRPMPVVMVSSLTSQNSEVTLRALELGAVDFVAKPSGSADLGLLQYAQVIVDKVRAASVAKLANVRVATSSAGRDEPESAKGHLVCEHDKIIAIGASTGGPEALRQVLEPLPVKVPPILITQHMPAGFTTSFAARLNRVCQIEVHEAQHNQPVQPGCAYLAPGGRAHMKLAKRGATYYIEIDESEPVNRHRPSVDVLFASVAAQAKSHAVGVLLTGMGKDGAHGLLQMRQAGAMTLAQDETSCVVFGMPKEAISIGAAQRIVPLSHMSAAVLSGR